MAQMPTSIAVHDPYGGVYAPQSQSSGWSPVHQQHIPQNQYASSSLPQQSQHYGQAKPASGSYYGAPDSGSPQYY